MKSTSSSSMIINFFLVFFIHSVRAFVNLADVECGVSKTRSGKIVNGVDAVKGEFPWMVSLKLRGQHFCGGAIIHKNWVLTAAHCVLNRGASQFQVTVGQHDLKDDSSAGKAVKGTKLKAFNVKAVIMHPTYVSRQVKDDIALINLDGDVEWSESVQPACLPKSIESSFSGRLATVAGWGWTNEVKNGGHRSDIMQKVDVPILDNQECQKWFKQEKKKLIIVDTCMCAGFEQGGKDSCQGDSGGPLMVEQDGRRLVVGVVSAGIGCARPHLPGIYARVNSYTDWVIKHVQKN